MGGVPSACTSLRSGLPSQTTVEMVIHTEVTAAGNALVPGNIDIHIYARMCCRTNSEFLFPCIATLAASSSRMSLQDSCAHMLFVTVAVCHVSNLIIPTDLNECGCIYQRAHRCEEHVCTCVCVCFINIVCSISCNFIHW